MDKEAHRRAETLGAALWAVRDHERAVGAKAYLKIDLEFYGVGAKPLRAVARSFLAEHPDIDRNQMLVLVRDLWARPIFEMKAVAVALLERSHRKLKTSDLELVEDLPRRSHTWALVDWLCTKIAAPLVEREPELALDFLLKHLDEASGLTLREGSKYLPPEAKARLNR